MAVDAVRGRVPRIKDTQRASRSILQMLPRGLTNPAGRIQSFKSSNRPGSSNKHPITELASYVAESGYPGPIDEPAPGAP